ncbi:MAG TPA: hypothetical protein VG496_12795 [Myxococcales bacterium]|nr:hypothetical protein [Myxococcales bacterium]
MRRLVLLICAVSLPALAYNEAIHVLITSSAFARRDAWLAEELQPPTQADLDAFRALFWRTAAQLPAADVRSRFLARWPSAASFTSWEFKQLFMLDPAATVHGFDLVDARSMKRGALLALASRWPDDDHRNRNRYLRGKDHEIVRAADGSPMPYDPATLDFGGLTGTTSQGHAHYGLVTGPLSDDPEVLKKEPWRFAVPPTAHAYGAEFAQLYTDLALLAATSNLPSRDWLAACFAGAAFHHIEDVGNQIHTVQVGIYQFFRDAWFQSKLRDLRTLGGVFGERRSLRQIGVRLIANHHLWSEDLFAKRVEANAPEVAGVPQSLRQDDPRLVSAVPPGDDFGRAIAQALIDISSREGGEVYRLAYRLTVPTLRDGMGHEYDGSKGDDPDRYLGKDDPQALDAFYDLEARGLRRAATAVRLWQPRFDSSRGRAEPGLVVLRSLAMLLPYHEAAAARRASYKPPPAERHEIAWGYPAAAVAIIGIAIAAVTRKRRRTAIAA